MVSSVLYQTFKKEVQTADLTRCAELVEWELPKAYNLDKLTADEFSRLDCLLMDRMFDLKEQTGERLYHLEYKGFLLTRYPMVADQCYTMRSKQSDPNNVVLVEYKF